ncbi:hypothetical protein [Streptomyces sp. NPDC004435]|uniref:hypothetical protein n=1 Tax=Streptomyces sp. NPDC004435 TaxID=3364701 RepID=UPI0036852D4B
MPTRVNLLRALVVPSPGREVEWVPEPEFQCLVEDVEHGFHAAYVRTGASDSTDVFLCWSGEGQWLMDVESCLKTRGALGIPCTSYRGHPGRCEWGYVDPPRVAREAASEQFLLAYYAELGIPHGGPL